MFLYNLTLKPPAFISKSITGSFTGEKRNEFLFVRGNSQIEICCPDAETGKLVSLMKQDVFCKIRDISPYRMIGSLKDFIILASDSGRIVILEYDPQTNTFEKLHQETFGKSGTRRIVPGQYLAIDPRGRAVMIAALEKAKLVYLLNCDSSKRLTISSPLETYKSNIITCHIVGLDVGFLNPVFAALEAERIQDSESWEKFLVFYELDLGINQVVRKWSHQVPKSSNLLIPLPEGIGGILVCFEGGIQWMNSSWNSNFPSITLPNASNEDLWDGRLNLVVSFVQHKSKNTFFVLILTEDGDLFKLTVDSSKKRLFLTYFDSFPGATSICLSKNGFLFIGGNSKTSNSLYQVQKLAEDEVFKFDEQSNTFTFDRHEKFHNLELTDCKDATFPILDAQLIQSSSDANCNLYACKGKSNLALLKSGLSTNSLANSPLPKAANGLWTIKGSSTDQFHSMLLISFEFTSVLLSIGESISVIQNSMGFHLNSPTIQCFTLHNNSHVQILPNSFRHIKELGSYQDWNVPLGKTITHATANESCVILVLDRVEILHFALDSLGNLREELERKLVPSFIESISIGLESKFLAIACSDGTCRIVSAISDNWLQMQSVQVFSAIPTAVELLKMNNSLYLHVCLANGEYHRIAVDSVTGALKDTRVRAVSSGSFKILPVNLDQNVKGVLLLLENRTILVHSWKDSILFSPLIFSDSSSSSFQYAASISSHLCNNAIIGIMQENLTIFSVNLDSSSFSLASEISLKLQPKRLIVSNDFLIVLQSEHFAKYNQPSERHSDEKSEKTLDAAEGHYHSNSFDPFSVHFSILRRYQKGHWASCLSIFSRGTNSLRQEIILSDNFVPISGCLIRFASHYDDGEYLVVGAAKNFTPNGGTFEKTALFTFQFNREERKFHLAHATEIEALPLALSAFHGMLLVGIGKALRMYDLGKKKLLRKCECISAARTQIMSIISKGLRIVIGDALSGVIFLHYKIQENQFIVIADDPIPRTLSCVCFVDWDTVACADKFGNLFVNRISDSLSENIERDPTCSKLSERPYLLGAPTKTTSIAEFHLGELVTSIQKGILSFGSQECIIWTTVLGRIGIMAPFDRKSEYELFQSLEMEMRKEYGSGFGREHFSYRSNYLPCDNVIDGDLCEMFLRLSFQRKSEIALLLGKSILEISNLISSFRARFE